MSPAAPLATPPEMPAGRVMLLSLWRSDGGEWHARLVGTDATVHDFTSPFELARYLGRVPQPRHKLSARGLR
jgi:hypothetical protein